MMGALTAWTDRLLGRGEASISVPVFDGALKSNRLIEDADTLATLEAPMDLATDGQSVFVADGRRVWQHDGASANWAAREVSLDPAGSVPPSGQTITALACLPGGGLALALDGKAVQIVGGVHAGKRFDQAAGRPLVAANAIAATADGKLIVTDGSAKQPFERWKHDVMELGRSGRVLEFNLGQSNGRGNGRELASGLAYVFGACATGEGVWVCESWRHRVLSLGSSLGAAPTAPMPVIDNLPGYPSRIAAAAGGGYWLTCFALRTQLVEFVLREPAFRKRMLQEIDPAYWIAPALNSGNTFLEPMQGAHLKMMGVVKPWAPPRSYGLVIRLNEAGLIRYSLHSRFDGQNHGVVAAVECAGFLYLLAKGRNRLLRLSIEELERSLAA
jgi:hypothetical protein